MSMREITPTELKTMMASEAPPTVVDVREPWETAICALAGAQTIPMRTLPQRLQEIPNDRPVVLLCHHGQRSLMVAQYLDQAGYEAMSLRGGIERWAVEVEPGMARY
jgi:rhodanese-related sulfurtransferase